MRILLDECITRQLISFLGNFEVKTAGDMNWKGMKNGALLKKVAQDGFDIFLTIDKNILYQQNPVHYNISIVVLNAVSSNIESLQELIPEFIEGVRSFEKGKLYVINRQGSD
jgi:hypothetical protein